MRASSKSSSADAKRNISMKKSSNAGRPLSLGTPASHQDQAGLKPIAKQVPASSATAN